MRNISQSRYPDIKGLELGFFKKQLDFLQKEYTLISTEELIQALDTELELPENSALLTFDDGYIDHYTNVFPILSERNIPAFFSMPGKILAEGKVLDVNKIHFILASTPTEKILQEIYNQLNKYRKQGVNIPTNRELYEKLAIPNRFDSGDVVFIKRLLQVELEESLRNTIVDNLFEQFISLDENAFAKELYMSQDQVNHMARTDGITFGIHGYDHYWMNRLDPISLKEDISKALDVFSGIVDKKKWVCCYPYGSYSDDVISCAKKMGAVAGFGTDVAVASIDEKSRYILPRFDTNDFPPKSENYKQYITV